MNYVRRFVFVHYEDLLEVRFRQLEKVTDKLYVFVPESVEQVPMWLVRQMQDMGRDLSWVSVGAADYQQAQLILACQVGSLHEKVDPGVEFAILSDSDDVDLLVGHLQGLGRKCLRVKPRVGGGDREQDQEPRERSANGLAAERSANGRDGNGTERGLSSTSPSRTRHAEPEFDAIDIADDESEDFADDAEIEDLDLEDLDRKIGEGDANDGKESREPEGERLGRVARVRERASEKPTARRADRGGRREPLRAERGREEEEALVAPLADDVVRKLIRSGNRPNEVSMLRSYILLHSAEADAVRYVDEIIARMRRKGEIQVEGTSVKYTF